MASRRMFANSIIGSARFLRMPAAARLLYYDLGMDGDDDGYVEAFTVLRKTGASEDDLQILVDKGFVRVLNEDLVTLICDWKTNNLIKSDRYHQSVYSGLEDGNEVGTTLEPNEFQDGSNVEPESRLGKSSQSQAISGQGSAEGSEAAAAATYDGAKSDPDFDREERIRYLRKMLRLYQSEILCDPEQKEMFQSELDQLLQEADQ